MRSTVKNFLLKWPSSIFKGIEIIVKTYKETIYIRLSFVERLKINKFFKSRLKNKFSSILSGSKRLMRDISFVISRVFCATRIAWHKWYVFFLLKNRIDRRWKKSNENFKRVFCDIWKWGEGGTRQFSIP